MKPKLKKELLRFNQEQKNRRGSLYYEFLLSVCKFKDSPIARNIRGLVEAKDDVGLLDYSDVLVAQSYATASEHFEAHQFAALVRKYPGLKVPVNPTQTAMVTFASSEHRCKRYNQKFDASRRFGLKSYENSFSRMRNFIRYVLGETPSLPAIYRNCGFGPGASIGANGNVTHYARKIAAEWTVTPGLLSFAPSMMACSHPYIWEYISRCEDEPYVCYDYERFSARVVERCSVITYNKIAFVPKTAKTDRSIAVEPLLNSYFQKGIDLVMRDRLRRIGIDLSDQERNKELARQGSFDDPDGYVTIDLSSASDSISIGLCRDLLPPAWFDLLNASRSQYYKGTDGVSHKYHKFCSMGNGFCFPLETLLFTAAAYAAGAGSPRTDFSVYGDDIIVRKHAAESTLDLLRAMGFRENTKKTLLSGPFRESCGADWFGGMDVRPFTLDFELDSLSALFKAYNLCQRSERVKAFLWLGMASLLRAIPRDLQYMRPYPGNADTALTVDMDTFMASPHSRFNAGLQCWSWRELSHVAKQCKAWQWWKAADTLLVMAALRGSSSSAPYTLRRMTRTTVRMVSHGGGHATWLPGDRFPERGSVVSVDESPDLI